MFYVIVLFNLHDTPGCCYAILMIIYFTVEETEDHRGEGTCPTSYSKKQGSQDFNLCGTLPFLIAFPPKT